MGSDIEYDGSSFSRFDFACWLRAQVMGSVQAWQEASVQDRMERLVAPGWRDFWPLVERSLKRLSGARSCCTL